MKHRQRKKILFYLGHPAHYHNIKVVASRLREKGHQTVFVARKKDVLFDLLDKNHSPHYFLPERKGRSKVSIALSVLKREFKMNGIIKRERPDLLVGTDIVISHIGKMRGIPSLIINEDDASEVPLLARYGFPYADAVLAPACCEIRPAEEKKVAYEGYHELAYLHPSVFTPDAKKVHSLMAEGKPYFILRFADLVAHHDKGKSGIEMKLALRLINLLKNFGRVFITAERKLETELEPYRINIHPSNIHHALAFAKMYIGDSQTMTAEAAVLGTPSIRYNDFVGKLSYLEELESRYGLTYGYRVGESEALLTKVKELLNDKDLRQTWDRKRQKMLKEKINVAAFWEWLMENYPQSVKEVKEKPDIMKQFYD